MFSITSQPIEELPKLPPAPSCGAQVVFEGVVRDNNDGEQVKSLEYEAMELLANKEGSRILQEAAERFQIVAAECVHRVGHLQVGDVAVRVIVSAGHRKEAFAACQYIVDEVKSRVPIWKKEHYASGQSEWINAGRNAETP